MAQAGNFITILRPKTHIALLDAVFPSMSLPVGGVWPTGWKHVVNTAQGVNITPVNPKEDVPSDENGILDSLAAGGDTINMTWQARTPQMELVQWISGFARVAVAQQAGPPAFPAYEGYYLDPDTNNNFMVGIEGTAQAGGLFNTAKNVRVFAFRAEQTDNPELSARSVGADGILQPSATVRCLPANITSTQLEGTGLTIVDPKKRFGWYVWDQTPAT